MAFRRVEVELSSAGTESERQRRIWSQWRGFRRTLALPPRSALPLQDTASTRPISQALAKARRPPRSAAPEQRIAYIVRFAPSPFPSSHPILSKPPLLRDPLLHQPRHLFPPILLWIPIAQQALLLMSARGGNPTINPLSLPIPAKGGRERRNAPSTLLPIKDHDVIPRKPLLLLPAQQTRTRRRGVRRCDGSRAMDLFKKVQHVFFADREFAGLWERGGVSGEKGREEGKGGRERRTCRPLACFRRRRVGDGSSWPF